MSEVPKRIRRAGWTAAAMGGIVILADLVNLLSYAVSPQSVEVARTAPSRGVHDLIFSHFLILIMIHGFMAALVLVSGVELSQGKEAGRRRLAMVLWAAIPLVVFAAAFMLSGFLSMPTPPSDLMAMIGLNEQWFRALLVVGGVIVTMLMLGIAALLYLAIRWLDSPSVRAACRLSSGAG